MNICGGGMCVCDNYEYPETECSEAQNPICPDPVPIQWYYYDSSVGVVLSIEPEEAEAGTTYYLDPSLTKLVSVSVPKDRIRSCPRHPHWSGMIWDCIFCNEAKEDINRLTAEVELLRRQVKASLDPKQIFTVSNEYIASVKAEGLREAADALEWKRPEVCPCDHPEDCCGSESSCDAMQPVNNVVGKEWLRKRAAQIEKGEDK